MSRDRRTEKVQFRTLPALKTTVKVHAELSGLSMSEYIERALFNAIEMDVLKMDPRALIFAVKRDGLPTLDDVSHVKPSPIPKPKK